MKLSKKFFEDLHKIGEDAFIEKNMWIGKLVPEIIVDNLQKRGLSQEDIEDCVMLSIEEASEVWDSLVNLVSYVESIDGGMSVLVRDGQRNIDLIRNRIKQAESK